MNIHEVAKSGLPFRHPDMIGAWMIVDGTMVHRDNIGDFQDMIWITANCVNHGHKELYWMDVDDLLRTDWETVTVFMKSRLSNNR